MKALKILALLSSAALLAACGSGAGNSGKETSKEDSVETTSIVESTEEKPTGMTPEEAVTHIAAFWEGTVKEVQTGVYGTAAVFPAASYSVEDLKNYVSTTFVPEEFELIDDWETGEDGAESCFYVNAIATALEIYVFSDTYIVDADGKILEESSEGASEVEVSGIEVYGYTAQPQ